VKQIFSIRSLVWSIGISSGLFFSSPLFVSWANAEGKYDANESTFRLPVEGTLLRTAVDFWVKIYGTYTTKQGVIHDAKDLTVVYEVLDFSDSNQKQSRQVREAKNKYRQILLKLHRLKIVDHPEKLKDLTEEESRVAKLFEKSSDRQKFLNASHFKRLRFQLGQKDRMREGIIESGRYLPFMEEIFHQEGLPRELTRLPFVESSFNTRARSKVGASGIWQFMRVTGKVFMKINTSVDERNDPLRATEAAAQLLKINYDSLGNWPLAVTAYNHGRTGMMRAVRKLGTDDLQQIIEMNKARSFGFASSNFYACLLAAIEVEKNAESYLGEVPREKPHFFYEVALPNAIKLSDLVKFMGLNQNAVEDLNPGLQTPTLKSRERINAGYRLRLPLIGEGSEADKASQARVFLAGFEKIPSVLKGLKK
jgi:membrane-bound lytic murein transglycosylase D